MNSQRTISASPAGMRAFTIVELLVVMGIIILLLSLVVVGLNAASKASQRASTSNLMTNITSALTLFKGDMGYLPPVLGPDGTHLRDLFPSPPPLPDTPGQAEVNLLQEWWSSCALADFLIGYGSHREDGYGVVPGQSGGQAWSDENPPLGIRSPGPDGLWGAATYGAATGALADRMKYGNAQWGGSLDVPARPWDQGKVYGPYIRVSDERLLGAVYYPTGPGGGDAQTFFPGDTLPAGQTWDTMPKAICDYWGRPIRYYRTPYLTLKQPYRSGMYTSAGAINFTPSLSDVFLLRPWSTRAGEEVFDTSRLPDASGDTTMSHAVTSAEFAVFSSGPDKRLNQTRRVDVEEFNRDNLVEAGP